MVVLAGVSVIVFALVHLVPGDPVRLALGTRFSQETYDALRERSGLDLPLVQQFFTWLGGAVTGEDSAGRDGIQPDPTHDLR